MKQNHQQSEKIVGGWNAFWYGVLFQAAAAQAAYRCRRDALGLPKENTLLDNARITNGQEMQPVNAAMYSRLRYTPWVDFPPQNSNPLDTWLEIYHSF